MHNDVAFHLYLDNSHVVHEIHTDVQTARRKVAGWVVSEVSTSCMAQTPGLVVDDSQVYWRVPVAFLRPGIGVIGIIGNVHVDAMTGEMNVTPQFAEQLFSAAVNLSKAHPHAHPTL